MKKTSYEISYDVITSMGNEKTNEDAYGILELPDKNTFFVCDGLGGHGDGEVASSFCCRDHETVFGRGTFGRRQYYEKSEPITGKAAAGT